MSKKQNEINTIAINGEEYVKLTDVQHTKPDELNGLKYAIVRSRNQGVMSGYVYDICGQCVTLKRARQLWKWSSDFVLTDMAEKGIKTKSDCKFSCEASQDTIMLEACGVLYCSSKAGESIRSVSSYSDE
jgi:hypothetical protein